MGSYVALIEEYEHKLKDLLISEHFVGRTNDLWEILQMFSLKSDTQTLTARRNKFVSVRKVNKFTLRHWFTMSVCKAMVLWDFQYVCGR